MATTRVEEIGKAVIKTVDDFPITLADIANVQIGAKTPKLGVASEKGKPAVLVTVTKQPGTNTLELTDKLDASIQDRKTSRFRQTFSGNPVLSTVRSTTSRKLYWKELFL